jgi:hypothetical protein
VNPWNFIIHAGEKCTGCYKPCFRENVRPRGIPGAAKFFGFHVILCQDCGKFLALEKGKIRSLTGDEIKRLPTHPNAALMRKEQTLILERLWG